MASTDEAVSNVASLYNGTNMTVDTLSVTKDLKAPRIILGDKFILSGVKDFSANDDWLRLSNKDNTAYGGGLAANKIWSAGDMNVEGNAQFNKNINAGSISTPNLKIGDWTIYQDGQGRLQFQRGGKNLVSLAKDENDTSVFRSSGLMYTNKLNRNTPNVQLWKTTRPQAYNVMKADPDRDQNIMYLGGTHGQDYNQNWTVVSQRVIDTNRTAACQVSLHGHAPVCPGDCGQGGWGQAYF